MPNLSSSSQLHPLIIEPNFEVILEVQSPLFQEVQDKISVFCSLVKSPSFFFTYVIDMVSLWNGFASGWDDKEMISTLKKYSRYPLPEKIRTFIEKTFNNFGIFSLENYTSSCHQLKFQGEEPTIALEILSQRNLSGLWKEIGKKWMVPVELKYIFKSEMAQLGYIIRDFTEFTEGDPITINFVSEFKLRHYQKEAIASFLNQTLIDKGGAGTVIMPCGSGKTMVGIGIMKKLSTSTLIITPNLVSLKQWKKEILEKTDVGEENIGEYSSLIKDLKLITLTTYQIISYRDIEKKEFKHLGIFKERNWGLVIYDEIHMLPADIFRYTTGIESKRRLGLTATLVREDGREEEVFSLVGPKKYDLPWKELEKINFIAQVNCFEVKVAMSSMVERNYYTALSEWDRYRIAAENSDKFFWVDRILDRFPNKSIIIIGQFLEQLQDICHYLNRQKKYGEIPLLTGKTQQLERLKVYDRFKNYDVRVLVVSKIANFAIDLPNADVAIQLSGTFGSRQEETQRLGRIIRPKVGRGNNNQAFFFTLVTKNSREEILAQNRKTFLINQGYHYETVVSESIFNSLLEKFLKKVSTNS